MRAGTVRKLVADEVYPALMAERKRLDRIDRWWRWDHDDPHKPLETARTDEYAELIARAQTPWLALVVTATAQELYVEGYRSAESDQEALAWRYWGMNGLDARQVPVHRAGLGYGYSFASVVRGRSSLGEPMPVVRGISPRNSMAFYLDPAGDDWPAYFLDVSPAKIDGGRGWAARFWDDELIHRLQIDAAGKVTPIDHVPHGAGVCPIVRFAQQLDLEGRADGEVEPLIPLAGRIDQTVFDRLVVQRYGAFVVRYVTGMTKPANAEEAAAVAKLAVDRLLVAESPDSKFGSLDATQLEGYIRAGESDLDTLAAVSQTPAHELRGAVENLSADALVAARMSLTRKVEERKHAFGQSWEQVLRLCARTMGDLEGAKDMTAQVRWRKMEGRSLAQAADALGKFADQLKVPVEMLWEDIPDWTQQDVERAKALRDRLAAEGQQMPGLDALVDALARGQQPSR